MFKELAALIPNTRGSIIMSLCRIGDNTLRLSIHPHAENPADRPNIVPICLEGGADELDAPGIDLSPIAQPTRAPLADQIKTQAAAAAAAAPAPAPAPTPATPATAAPVAKTKRGKRTAVETPAATETPEAEEEPTKTPEELEAERKQKEDQEAAEKKAAEERAAAEAKAEQERKEKAKRDHEEKIAKLRADLAALEGGAS